MTRRFLRVAGGYLFVLLFITVCAYYIATHREDFAYVARISWIHVSLAAGCIGTSLVLSAYIFDLFFRHFRLRLGFWELAALTMGVFLGNLVLPLRGGSAAMAVYLKRRHDLQYRTFGVIYGGTGLLIALINTGLGLAGIVLLWLGHGYRHPALTLVVGGMFGILVYLTVFPPSLAWKGKGWTGFVFEMAHSWHVLSRNRSLLLRLTFGFFLIAVAQATGFHYIYGAIGVSLSPLATLTVSSLGSVANLVPLTPGALGIVDAVVIQIPQVFGLEPSRAVGAAIVFRALSFAWTCVLGLPGLLYLLAFSRSPQQPLQ